MTQEEVRKIRTMKMKPEDRPYLYQFDGRVGYVDARKLTSTEKTAFCELARAYTSDCCSIGLKGTAYSMFKDHFPEELI